MNNPAYPNSVGPGLVIAFDADDTLWRNEDYYQHALEKFQTLLSECGDPAQVAQSLAEVEVRNIGWYGYGIKSFTLSMIETAVAVAGENVTPTLMQSILQLGRGMLNADVVLLDQADAVLNELAQDHILMLITKGDLLEQGNKLKRSGLARYFQLVEIVEEKTDASYRNLLEKYGISADRFVMVGNSLKSDVLPVLQIGGMAVFVPYAHTWAHEHAEAGGHTFHQIEHLGQLPGLIGRMTNPT
jgi:putative hydrolase of the HAD superfamily